jgi:hypothetical protein
MKELMRQLYKVILIATIFMIQSCGSSSDKTVFTISAGVSEANFTNEYLQESTDTIAIEVNFVGNGLLVGFSPDTLPVPWLEYRAENITANSATVYIDIINAQFLTPDTYETKLRLATSNDDSSKFAFHEIDISLLIWDFAVDTDKIKYNGTLGDDAIPAQTITILNETKEWTASTDVTWLSLDVTSGSGEAEIVVTPDISGFLEAGLQQANIILTELNSGDTKLVPVELALDNVYLLAEQTTVALASTSSKSTLEKTLTIDNSRDLNINWQATTSASWLKLTVINDHQLKISADPSIAAMNNNSYAQVIITANSDIAAVSEIINVNFYNSNAVFENKVLTSLEVNNGEILVSPLKPEFYFTLDNQLFIYHQYTGELESSIVVSPEGTVLEQLIIHPNGDYLLAKATEMVIQEDETTTEVVHRYRINLLDNTSSSITEILTADIVYEPIDIVRLSGRYFVVTQALEFANEDLQVAFWDSENAYFTNKVDVATQANTLFVLDNNAVSFKRYIPQVNDFGDDKISVTLTHEYHPELLTEGQVIYDFMVTNDEADIYAISPSSEWISFDGETFIDNGLLEANKNIVTLFLEKNTDSQPNYLRIDSTSELGFYLDIYDNNQTISSTIYTQGNQPNNIKLSGDGQRLIIHVNSSNDPEFDSQIELVTIP